MHDDAIRRYAALAVPRYTSYPTAADFVPVGMDTTRRWLRQIGPEESVSLYIHVAVLQSDMPLLRLQRKNGDT
ncbi:hypothetical protein C963_00928 [Brucella melitensis CNGB 1120]|nr:hypothetical protein C963_00928 [Brucella melitensis CNGB 1120]